MREEPPRDLSDIDTIVVMPDPGRAYGLIEASAGPFRLNVARHLSQSLQPLLPLPQIGGRDIDPSVVSILGLDHRSTHQTLAVW
jgi:hypothetical protein